MGERTQGVRARVGVVSPAPILADGVATLLDGDPMLSCVISSSDATLAIAMLRDAKLDALVLDDDVLDESVVADATIKPSAPGAVVVLLSAERPCDHALRLWSRLPGRVGLVEKRAGLPALAESLRDVLSIAAGNDGTVVPPAG